MQLFDNTTLCLCLFPDFLFVSLFSPSLSRTLVPSFLRTVCVCALLILFNMSASARDAATLDSRGGTARNDRIRTMRACVTASVHTFYCAFRRVYRRGKKKKRLFFSRALECTVYSCYKIIRLYIASRERERKEIAIMARSMCCQPSPWHSCFSPSLSLSLPSPLPSDFSLPSSIPSLSH